MVAVQYPTTDIDAELEHIAECLTVASCSPADLQAAAERLRQFARAAGEASQGDLSQYSNLLASLLVIAGSSRPDECGVDDNATAIVTFVCAELPKLRNALGGYEATEFERAQVEARQKWGEWLALVEPLTPGNAETCISAEEEWSHEDPGMAASAANLLDAMDSPSTHEIERLLTALNLAASGDVPSGTGSCPAQDNLETRTGSHPLAKHVAEVRNDPPVLDRELRDAFLEDAHRCLGAMEAAALAAQNEPGNAHTIRQVCRELHTLKGASASVGMNDIAAYLHEVEEGLQSLQGQPAVEATWRTVFETVDQVRSRIAALAPQAKPHGANAPRAFAAGDVSNVPAPRVEDAGAHTEDTVRIKASQLDRLLDMLAELVMLRNRRESRVAQLKQMNGELLVCVSRLRLAEDDRRSSARLKSSSKPLTELASDILEITRSMRDLYEPISQENHEVSHFIRQFRQELVQLSRLPVSSLFRRIQRVAHDAAQAEGKKVHVECLGDSIGLDRSLQERLYEPLLHIVRNGVSHGIESESQRVASGKTPQGTITLAAQSGVNLLILEVRDDGQGLDYQAIHRRGLERGLLSPDRTPTQQELSQLIFQPGFSTRTTADQVSGRGVGMDVVEETLRRLRGWVEVQSTPHTGTRIRLFVPLRSVIEHVMVFRTSGQLFGVPLYHVHRTGVWQEEPLTPKAGDAADIPGGTSPFPAVDFGDLFAASHSDRRPPEHFLVLDQSGSRGNAESASDRPSCTPPVASQPCRLTVRVDEIVGPEEVVVRPLPPLLRGQGYCSGATLSGSGEILLLLDGHQLCQLVRHHPQATPVDSRLPAVPRPRREPPTALVVDDSLSARRALVQILARYGLRVAEAIDGADAIEQLRTGSFAIVFTDIEMPRADGFSVLEFVKSRRETRELPVVVVSSRTSSEYRERATTLGAAAFLAKPLCDSALIEVLDRLAVRAVMER